MQHLLLKLTKAAPMVRHSLSMEPTSITQHYDQSELTSEEGKESQEKKE